jgi:hypothetical protein
VLLEQQHEQLLLLHNADDAVVTVTVTRWSCTTPPLPCLSPLSFIVIATYCHA